MYLGTNIYDKQGGFEAKWMNCSQLGTAHYSSVQEHTATHYRFYREQQLDPHLNPLNTKMTTIYDVGNPGPGLE